MVKIMEETFMYNRGFITEHFSRKIIRIKQAADLYRISREYSLCC